MLFRSSYTRNFERGCALLVSHGEPSWWATTPSMLAAKPNRARTDRRSVAPWHSSTALAVATKPNRCRSNFCIWWGIATPMPARRRGYRPARRRKNLERRERLLKRRKIRSGSSAATTGEPANAGSSNRPVLLSPVILVTCNACHESLPMSDSEILDGNALVSPSSESKGSGNSLIRRGFGSKPSIVKRYRHRRGVSEPPGPQTQVIFLMQAPPPRREGSSHFKPAVNVR